MGKRAGAVVAGGWPVAKVGFEGWLESAFSAGSGWAVAAGEVGAQGDEPEPEPPVPVDTGTAAEDSSAGLPG